MRPLDTLVIWMNRARCALSHRRYQPENVLLLLPLCLQNHNCKELVKNDVRECRACGRCKMKEIKALVERSGIPVCVATGGRMAQQRARDPKVRVILAVACRRELAEGIRAVFPKKVYGVPNSWPNGPCKDTDVDVKALEAALSQLLEPCRREETR